MLDVSSHLIPQKERIELILQGNELWDIVNSTQANTVHVLTSTDDVALETFNMKDIKAKRIIIDEVKHHVIHHETGKDHSYEMWDSLTKLYHSQNENQKMVLRDNLNTINIGYI